MDGCYITGALTVLFPDPSRLQKTNLNYCVNTHVTLRFIEPSLINKNVVKHSQFSSLLSIQMNPSNRLMRIH